MEVTTTPVEWDLQEDREIWAQFLKTRTGQRIIPKILENVPSLLTKGADNEIFIRSGEVRGWQASVTSLLSLAVVEPEDKPSSVSTHPDLLDDSQWDGPKLNPETPEK